MKSPLDTTFVKEFVEQMGDVGVKLVKGSETVTEIDEIDVGTAPKAGLRGRRVIEHRRLGAGSSELSASLDQTSGGAWPAFAPPGLSPAAARRRHRIRYHVVL